MQNEGYDGVIREEDGVIWEYVAFNPNQIKSADPVTYDDNGNVIPLSERFNPEKEDIRYSLATDVVSILEEYDTEGVKYGSILDVADAIEGLIAESTENTTEFENILDDFRAAQDDARRWGNRMDSGGEEEFEEALRAYVNKATLGERSGVISGNSSSEGLLASPNGPLSLVSFGNKQDATKVKSFEDISKATREIMPRIKKVINRGGLEDVRTEVDAVRAVGRALKLEPSHSSKSYYGEYFEGDYSVAGDIVRVRVSTHPANPLEITKVRKGVDPNHKVSIVIRKNGEHKSDGTPHSGYTEYVYEPSEVTPQDAANAVVKGVKSLLETGEFVDETGKAVRRDYPYTDKSGTTMYSLITPEMDASASAPTAETQTITTSNGDMIADVNEATGQGRFSLRTYHEEGRDVLAEFLGTRVSDGALTEAEAQDMVQQMDDIYAFCETMKDHYAPFGQWSEAKVRISAR